MTQVQVAGQIPQAVRDEIERELHSVDTFNGLAKQHRDDAAAEIRKAERLERLARESKARAERLRRNEWVSA